MIFNKVPKLDLNRNVVLDKRMDCTSAAVNVDSGMEPHYTMVVIECMNV